MLTPTGLLYKQLMNSYFSKTAPSQEKISHVAASEPDFIQKLFEMPEEILKSTVVVIDEVDNFIL